MAGRPTSVNEVQQISYLAKSKVLEKNKILSPFIAKRIRADTHAYLNASQKITTDRVFLIKCHVKESDLHATNLSNSMLTSSIFQNNSERKEKDRGREG